MREASRMLKGRLAPSQSSLAAEIGNRLTYLGSLFPSPSCSHGSGKRGEQIIRCEQLLEVKTLAHDQTQDKDSDSEIHLPSSFLLY